MRVVMMVMEYSSEVITLTENAEHNLSANQAYEYLSKAGSIYKDYVCLSANPCVQPKGG